MINTITPGWVTFGLALPQGSGKSIAFDAPCQFDVKKRYDDGTVKFGIVTTRGGSGGAWKPTLSIGFEGNPTTVPEVNHAFRMVFRFSNGTVVSVVPPKGSVDTWLSGPLVTERRTVVPVAYGIVVVFDTRSYVDGSVRMDVCVENCLDLAGSDVRVYTCEMWDGSNKLATYNVSHYYLTRWRWTCGLNGFVGGTCVQDFSSAFDSGLMPRWDSSVIDYADVIPSEDGQRPGQYLPLSAGGLNPYMGDVGGRDEIGLLPWRYVRGVVHRRASQLELIKAVGDTAASWPIHIRNAVTGAPVNIDQRPQFWLDMSWRGDDKPMTDVRGRTGPLKPDASHTPALSLIPYLITGDRFHADELAWWAHFALYGTYQDRLKNARGGSLGLLKGNIQVRGVAWPLRNLGHAYAWLPDQDVGYFRGKIASNKAWFAEQVANSPSPYSFMDDARPENKGSLAIVALWERNYLASSLEYIGEEVLKRHLVTLQCDLLTNPGTYDARFAMPMTFGIGNRSYAGGPISSYAQTLEALAAINIWPGRTPNPTLGYYGVDARMALIYGLRMGLPGLKSAYDSLTTTVCKTRFNNQPSDAGWRCGFDIAL